MENIQIISQFPMPAAGGLSVVQWVREAVCAWPTSQRAFAGKDTTISNNTFATDRSGRRSPLDLLWISLNLPWMARARTYQFKLNVKNSKLNHKKCLSKGDFRSKWSANRQSAVGESDRNIIKKAKPFIIPGSVQIELFLWSITFMESLFWSKY